MRTLGLAMLVLSVAACGGGGGGGGTDTTAGTVADETISGPGPDDNLVLQILEDCGLSKLDDFLDIVEQYGSLLDPEAAPPDFKITGITLSGIVSFTVDFDSDQQVDASGTLRFTDDSGKTIIPLNLLTLILGGTDDLQGFVSALDDGTHVVLTVDSNLDPDFTGEFDFELANGAVSAVSGDGTVTRDQCEADFAFDDIGIEDLEGEYPIADLEIGVISSAGGVEGTVAMDGTNVANLDLTLNGGSDVYSYTYDLDTQQVDRVTD